jgi:hypothetical protein
MPRIFAPSETYNSNAGALTFVNSAAEIASTKTDAIAYYTAEGYDVDTSKNTLTVFDTLTRDQLDDISLFFKVALVPADDRKTLIRKIETAASALLLGSLTVASTDGAVLGDTNIDITPNTPATGTAYKYKVAAGAAPALLYGDYADSTWTTILDNGDITATTGHFVTVVEVNAAGLVLALGSDTVDSNDA